MFFDRSVAVFDHLRFQDNPPKQEERKGPSLLPLSGEGIELTAIAV